MNTLADRIAAKSAAEVHPAVAAFAAQLSEETDAIAVLFYGSNLRTGSLEGVLDYYILLPGPQQEKIWPKVSYREWAFEDITLRAKIATMSLEQFEKAASGQSRDTTIWARFVQPSALVWSKDANSREQLLDALGSAAKTAAKLAVALGPEKGTAGDYWRALFRATYKAEFRVEKTGRETSILSVNAEHFDGLLPLALAAQGIEFAEADDELIPVLSDQQRAETLAWWSTRQRIGKPLNILRLLKASTTFDGAARYAAWKVERHTGVPIEVTPWREKHPVLAAPSVLFKVWREQKRQGG